MKVGDLFSGIGGFSLAAEWTGWETIWFSEIDDYASKVLKKHWPAVPNLGDITKIDWSSVERPDLLCGGFPCQPVSLAGKGLAQDDERWLWPEFARAIHDLRPRYVVVENVPGLLARGMGDVLGDLAAIGYDAEWQVLSAADVGAPHLRRRVWIVAHPNGGRELQPQGSEPDERGRVGDGGPPSPVAHPECVNTGRYGEWWPSGVGWWEREPGEALRITRERGRQEDGVPDLESLLGRVAHGVPSRVDRLKCLGNAIVPQCAYRIFQRIAEWEGLT